MQSRVAEPQQRQDDAANPYQLGNYAPIDYETSSFALPVEGELPAELHGRLVRIGPNPSRLPNAQSGHWFTGIGMVHGLHLADGKAAWYRSRFVRAGRGARLLGLDVVPGPTGGDEYNVNTTVIPIAGRLFAAVEGGAFPVELSYELDSLARSDLGGLRKGFAAHVKADPQTGELFAIAYQPGRPNVQYVHIDVCGRARIKAEISVPHMPLIHDLGLTASSVIVLDLPVLFDSAKVRAESFPYSWHEEHQARVGLLPRDGDVKQLKWFDAPQCFVFHTLNAYDAGASVVLDVVRHPKKFASGRSELSEGTPLLARWTLDRVTGKVSEDIVYDLGCEFPRSNRSVVGCPYRYGYASTADSSARKGPTTKHDMKTGITLTHDYGDGRTALEPIFVPRIDATAEDDGWVLSFVYDASRNASDIVILDAQNFCDRPVATIELPVRVPFGFHGEWLPDA